MCFTGRTVAGKIPKPTVAKKNILVYKVLDQHDHGCYRSVTIRGNTEPYTRNYVYRETTPFKDAFLGKGRYHNNGDARFFSVEGNALHSCKSLYIAGEKHHGRRVDRKIVTMVIPKGARYYEGVGEYISDQLWFPTEAEEKRLRNKKK